MEIPEIAYEHHLKVPVIMREHYQILLEQHISGTFIHCNVTSWSSEIAKALKKDFDCLCDLHGGPIHALHDSRDRKHEKFLRFYGFQRLQAINGTEELWIWRNNGKSI